MLASLSASSGRPSSNGNRLSEQQMGLTGEVHAKRAAHRVFLDVPTCFRKRPGRMIDLASEKNIPSIGRVQTVAGRQPIL